MSDDKAGITDLGTLYQILEQILFAGREHTDAILGLVNRINEIYHEVTRPLPPSPVPAKLDDIIAQLDRIEDRLALLERAG